MVFAVEHERLGRDGNIVDEQDTRRVRLLRACHGQAQYDERNNQRIAIYFHNHFRFFDGCLVMGKPCCGYRKRSAERIRLSSFRIPLIARNRNTMAMGNRKKPTPILPADRKRCTSAKALLAEVYSQNPNNAMSTISRTINWICSLRFLNLKIV